jgi:hypothetical protein
MGACSSKKQNYKLQRGLAQKHIEIDFAKLMKYNREREGKEVKEGKQQQSFC